VGGDATAGGDQRERGLAHVTADVVEDDVGARAAERRPRPLDPVRRLGVDDGVGALPADEGELALVAGDGDDPRRASWTETIPSPPLAPTTRTRSAAPIARPSNSASAVGPSWRSAAASRSPRPSGTGERPSAGTSARSA
jgi:hypothetical protein